MTKWKSKEGEHFIKGTVSATRVREGEEWDSKGYF